MFKKVLTFMLIGFIALSLSAQKIMDKGTIIAEITNVSSSDSAMAMVTQLMNGSQTKVYFNESKHVTEMEMMGGMIIIKNQIDQKTNTFDMLMDMSIAGQKVWISSNLDELKNGENAKKAAAAKIEYDKKDRKTILGYDCYAMNVSMPDAKDMKIKAYICEAIKTKANIIQGMESLQINGYPMSFTIDSPAMSMTMETKEISDKVDETNLTLNTEGFTKMTMQQFKEMMGGFGGFGF